MPTPLKYNPAYHDDWAWSLAIKGATDQDIADAFHVSRRTIIRWRQTYPSFNTACQSGKEVADAKVKKSLFERAVGFEYQEKESVIDVDPRTGEQKPVRVRTLTKKAVPDTMAQMYWLNNRCREEFSQTQKVTLDGSVQARPYENLSEEELREALACMKKTPNKRSYSKAQKAASREELRNELARRYYADYVQYVHMGRWKRARHLDLVCEKLESIIEGKTKRLMIFMPPRHGKSMTVTETFPSFYLGKNPEKRVIEISYSGDLAQQFGKRNRDKVEEFGPALFGHTISQVQATKTNWNLDNGMGGMISVGIGGSITGYGADLLIVDDPIKNRAEAESATYRDKLWDEYQSTVSTRLHAGGAVIIILTRWHEDDLAARLLNPEYGKVEDWDIISLPAVCEDLWAVS